MNANLSPARKSLLILVTLLLAPSILWPQRPKSKASGHAEAVSLAAEQKLKGVWEPVSYPADVHLNDVYFATPERGWVSAGKHGQPGMIISTKDGGANWAVQLGDPEGSDPPFQGFRFIEAQTGWVLQQAGGSYKLLHTSDGDSWSETGSIKYEWGVPDYAFISPSEGLYLDGNDNVSRIMRSSDGGRTWNEVFACKATLPIDGLTKKVDCALKTLHFPSSRVGYALGGAHGAKRTLFVAKTEDGGKTWSLSVVPDVGGDLEVYFDQEAFFTDEATGVVSLSDKRLYRTTDGGRTWRGVIGTPGPDIRFADPAVGWSFASYRTLSYTTNGGAKWTTREAPFPAKVTAFSLPRRDRGFVVGEHGMIYRYRALARGEAGLAKALPAPAMPAFDSSLDEQVSGLVPVVQALQQAVAAVPDSVPGVATAKPDAAADPSTETRDPAAESDMPPETEAEAEEAAETEVAKTMDPAAESDLPPETEAEAENAETEVAGAAEANEAEASAFTASCCAKPLGKFDLILTAVIGIVPQFLGQYKNTNLLLAGLQLLTDLPRRITELNNALRTFRKAPDKAAAMAALTKVNAAVGKLATSTAVAFQKQTTAATEAADEAAEAQAVNAREEPADEESAAAAEAEPEAEQLEETPEPEAAAQESEPAADSSEEVEEVTGAAAEKVEQTVNKGIKKKLRF